MGGSTGQNQLFVNLLTASFKSDHVNSTDPEGTELAWGRTGKNINKLNLTKNSRLSSIQFSKEQINADCEVTGDLVYTCWNNWRKP